LIFFAHLSLEEQISRKKHNFSNRNSGGSKETETVPKKILIIAFTLTFLTLALPAEESAGNTKGEESPQLQYEIVVTATRLETPAKEIASSITVITKEELEKSKKNTVLEILEGVLGITTIQNGPPGGVCSVFLRGANSEHTLVMIDGVEINNPISPSRSCDISHFSLDTVERIEILRGAQSTLYGSDALGGVINIITKKGEGRPRFLFSSSGGSYRSLVNNAELSGSIERFHYTFGLSHYITDGFSAANSSLEGNKEADGYRNLTLSGRTGYRPTDNIELDLSLRLIDTRSDIDNFGGAFGDDSNNIQEFDTLILKGGIRSLFLQNRWEQILNISYVNFNRTSENPTDEDHLFDSDHSDFKSNIWELDWQQNLFLHHSNTLTVGLEYQQEQGKSEFTSDSPFGPLSSIFPQKKAQTTAGYIQDRVRIADRFFATIGARVDHHSRAGTSVTYRFAPAYYIQQTGTKFKATLGTGFKSPSLYQLFAPPTFYGPIGNEDLKPEETTTWDIGIEQSLWQNRLTLGAAYFSCSFENLIDFNFGQGYINVLNSYSRGTEFFLWARPTENLLLEASYTRTEAKNKDTDESLLRRPKNKFTARLNFSFLEKGHLSISLIHTGEKDDIEVVGWTSKRVTISSYTLINAVTSYDILQNAQVFLRLDNVLDEEYEVIKGFGTPGLSVYGGFKIYF